MNYPISKSILKQFSKDANKRGYSKEQSAEYIEERKAIYKKHAPVGDAVVLGAVGGTFANIAYNSKGTTFKRATIVQFKPFFKEMNKTVQEIKNTKPKRGFIKTLAIGFAEGVIGSFRALKGFYKSVPKIIRVPATIIFLLSSATALMENNKIDAKHDAIKYIDERNAKAESKE